MSAQADPADAQRQLVLAAHLASIDFISDLHLCESRPRTLRTFQSYLRDPAWQALVILGDLFEVWVGDDALASGLEQQVGGWLAEATRTRPVWLMHGNRDFLIGAAFCAATGVKALSDPTVLQAFGEPILLTHGDALCLADVDYQRFRAQVRSPLWQAQFLARPLVERTTIAKSVRHASEARKQGTAMADWADVDFAQAVVWLDRAGATQMVHGHTHRPGTGSIGPRHTRHVLTDWDLDDAHQPRAETLRLSAAGFVRIPVAVPAD